MPPTQSPLRLEAEILSRMRSEVTSRSNWAYDSKTLRVSRPIEVVVLNCWVTETNDTLCWSNSPAAAAGRHLRANLLTRFRRAGMLAALRAGRALPLPVVELPTLPYRAII